jgi:hypothetical protein
VVKIGICACVLFVTILTDTKHCLFFYIYIEQIQISVTSEKSSIFKAEVFT